MDVDAQLRILRGPAPRTRLSRPCTLGDGLIPATDAADVPADVGRRLSFFVPASGAATRMVAGLVAVRKGADDPVGLQVVAHAGDLAAWPAGRAPRDTQDVLTVLLDELGLADVPKALVPFHRYAANDVRTAFEEQLREAALVQTGATSSAGQQPVHAHFTVSPEHRAEFEAKLAEIRPRIGPVEVTFSVQDPSTDTVAVYEDDGQPVLDGGDYLRRPGGHGALLGNLQASAGDLVLVKNIDNIVPDRLRPEVVAWRRRLLATLVRVEQDVHRHLDALDAAHGVDGAAATEAIAFLRSLGQPVPGNAGAAWARDRLDRPLRVCAMVTNDGQPGGGPFVVADGSLQIVESAQVDLGDPAQKAVWNAATHFNPVDMALALRDRRGRPWDLARYVDEGAAIVTSKTHEGRRIRVLERPGLWNGAMAGWLTVFVEAPRVTFQPVKTLADLLGEGHRP